VTVLALVDPMVTVRLPDGRVIETHGDNVQRSAPAEPRERKQPVKHRLPAIGCEEVPLW
jgi:hypothetical protein